MSLKRAVTLVCEMILQATLVLTANGIEHSSFGTSCRSPSNTLASASFTDSRGGPLTSLGKWGSQTDQVTELVHVKT